MHEHPVDRAPVHDQRRLSQVVLMAGEACVEALAPYVGQDWQAVRARDLDWSVWDTIVHVNDDLYFYAAQVLLADEGDYICFELKPDEHAPTERLLAAFTVNARVLAGTTVGADPTSRAHHVYGGSDPGGFAAMGVVEALIHTYDAVHGLDSASTWRPPDDLARPVLARLFPHTPPGLPARPGEVLLHMCGRLALGERPRATDWRWFGTPDSDPTTSL